jgi:hypothetical protein
MVTRSAWFSQARSAVGCHKPDRMCKIAQPRTGTWSSCVSTVACSALCIVHHQTPSEAVPCPPGMSPLNLHIVLAMKACLSSCPWCPPASGRRQVQPSLCVGPVFQMSTPTNTNFDGLPPAIAAMCLHRAARKRIVLFRCKIVYQHTAVAEAAQHQCHCQWSD